MKHLKILALAAVAAGVLTAIAGAGTASAGGTLCSVAPSPTNGPCSSASRWAVNTLLDFSLESGTTTRLTDTDGNIIDTCTESTIKGKLTSNPGGTTTATGENTTIEWGNCTWTTDTVKLQTGKLKLEAEDDNGNSWLYADEKIEVTIFIPLVGSCNYGVESGTKLGTIKEGKGTGATFTANAVATRMNETCPGPSTALWTASYVMTEPSSTTLWVATS